MQFQIEKARQSRATDGRWELIAAVAFLVVALVANWQWHAFVARRYNQEFGTHFTALDVMMGMHKTVRNVHQID